MLGKLIKHDFIATWKVIVGITALLVVIGSAASCFLRFFPLDQELNDIQQVTLIFLAMGYIVALVALSVIGFVYLVIHYYRNLYTTQGYLSFTLPASITQVVTSRMIVGIVWMFVLLLGACAAVLLPSAGFFGAITAEANITMEEFFADLAEVINDYQLNGLSSFLVRTVLASALDAIASLMMIYFAISVGQLWEKHKIIGSILCYFGAAFVAGLVETIVAVGSSPFNLFETQAVLSDIEVAGYINQQFIYNALLSIVWIAVYYGISILVSNRKLNLD
ncbi:MAG: hypothetical protein K6G23_06095 [Lachnospiraceae bacterium]|nr:hypothetical protein [Lachnospiraceae bacterium]